MKCCQRLNFKEVVRQTIVITGSMVMFGFVIEITSVKVKREERNRERTKLFEIGAMNRICPLDSSLGCFSLFITGVGRGSHWLEQNNLVFICALTSSEKSVGG